MGIHYTGFGVPTGGARHHYLWRIRKALPAGGHVGVFDRSHHEDVLVVRVHELVPATWEARYDEINAFEKELVDSGTTLVKCALFVSLDEQKRRLAERLDRPDKYWKYNPGDLDERKLWPAYQGRPTRRCSTAPRPSTPVVRHPLRQEVVRPAGDHRTAHRGAQGDEAGLAAARLRRRGGRRSSRRPEVRA